MVKAAAGGGGKGMRIVHSPSQLDEAVAAASREAAGGFGGRPRLLGALRRVIAPRRDPDPWRPARLHWSTWESASAPSNAGTRNSSRSPRRPRWTTRRATPWGRGRSHSAAPSATSRPAPSSSSWTTRRASSSSWKSTRASRSNTPSPRRSPASTSFASSCASRRRGARLRPGGHRVRRATPIEVRLCAEDPPAGSCPRRARSSPSSHRPSRASLGVRRRTRLRGRRRFRPAARQGHLPRTDAGPRPRARSPWPRAAAFGRSDDQPRLPRRTLRHGASSPARPRPTSSIASNPSSTLALDTDELAGPTAGALWLQGLHRANAPVLADLPSGWRNARLPAPAHAATLGRSDHRVDYRAPSRRHPSTWASDGHARVHDWSADRSTSKSTDVARRARVTRRGTPLRPVRPRHRGVRNRGAVRGPGRRASRPGAHRPHARSRHRGSRRAGQQVEAGRDLVVMEAMKMEHVISPRPTGTVERSS